MRPQTDSVRHRECFSYRCMKWNLRKIVRRRFSPPVSIQIDEVRLRMASLLEFDTNDIRVTVERGHVTLTGSVDDHDIKDALGKIATSLAGSRPIRNLLSIKPEFADE